MNLLLDTHAVLWWLRDSEELGQVARKAIVEAPIVYVSAATVWEIEIKRAQGRLSVPDDMIAEIDDAALSLMPIEAHHAVTAARLPPHHRDPFDRLLVAQAQMENLALVTADGRIPAYGGRVLSAT